MYDNARYANSRVAQTVLRDKKDKAVYIREVINNKGLFYYGRYKSQERCKAIPQNEINFEPIPLGFINTKVYDYVTDRNKKTCIFLYRIPKRHDWRQGLRKNTLGQYNLDRNINGNFNIDNFHELNNVIANSYPSLKETLEYVQKENKPLAFDRDFALYYTGENILYYKQKKIGTIKNRDVQFDQNYKYLMEKFQEITNEYCRAL